MGIMGFCLRSAAPAIAVACVVGSVPTVAWAGDDGEGGGGIHRNPPDSGPTLGARGSYEAWLTGTVAGHPIGNVYSSGPATQIDLGLLLGRGTTMYLGWQHAFYGAGNENPYVTAKLATVWTRADYFLVGVRYGCSSFSSLAGVWIGGDLGYEILHSDAADVAGNTASADLGNLAARFGLGACFRPVDNLVLAPSLMMNLLAEVGGQSSSFTIGGSTHDTSGDVQNKSLILGLSPGLGVQGEF